MTVLSVETESNTLALKLSKKREHGSMLLGNTCTGPGQKDNATLKLN